MTLSHLLLQISGHYKAYNKAASEDDEGYEQEEEETIGLDKALDVGLSLKEWKHKSVCSIFKTLLLFSQKACINNISEAEKHYQGVCRGLYAQAYELKAFLAKIEDSKVETLFLLNVKILFYFKFSPKNKECFTKIGRGHKQTLLLRSVRHKRLGQLVDASNTRAEEWRQAEKSVRCNGRLR